jgi:[ribosomal protein S5]-alanine N-acetyltransferase
MSASYASGAGPLLRSVDGQAWPMQELLKMRVIIRPPTGNDGPAFLAAVRRSRSLHRPWVSPPASTKAFAGYVERAVSETHRGFLVIHRRTGNLVGVINLNNVIRGAFQNAFLGYYSFLPQAGRGLMHEGMQLVLRHAFRKLKLHRLEANIQPGNHASIALARKCGFVREGFSRRYLKILGRWRDHERWTLLSEDFG